MLRLRILLLLLVAACAEPPARDVIVRAGRLIDGSGSAAQEQMRVRIRDGGIVAVEPDVGEPGVGLVIDARQLTVMPGLVDAHAHLFNAGACTAGLGAGPVQAMRNLHALLRGGVTTVADLGAPLELALALRRHVGTARHRGPRLLVSGPLLTAVGGYPLDFLGDQAREYGMVREVRTLLGARAIVRELDAAGVDMIKLAAQERSYNEQPSPMLSEELACAIVEEAHQQELRVFAHVTSAQGYNLALDCGVDVVAHASLEPLDAAIVARLAHRKISVLPTLFVFEAPLWGPQHLERLDEPAVAAVLSDEVRADLQRYAEADRAGAPTLPPFLMAGIPRQRHVEAVAAQQANTGQLHAAGVPLGLGTDAGVCYNLFGSPAEELERLAALGLSPLEVLTLATQGSARALNLHDALGRIAPGFRADLVAVAGEPDLRLADVRNVRLVLIDGVPQRLDGPTWGELASGVVRMLWAAL